MLVNVGDRGVDRHIPVDLTLGIRLGLESDQDRVPSPVLAEASVTPPEHLPRPELRWQITPRAPRSKTLDRPLDQRAITTASACPSPLSLEAATAQYEPTSPQKEQRYVTYHHDPASHPLNIGDTP